MRIPGALGLLLAVLAALRMAGAVVAGPLAAYANSYDFIRIEACLGLYPDVPGERTAGHPEAPLPRYGRAARLPANCQPGTAIVAPALAMAAAGGEWVPLRAVGIACTVVAALLVLAFAWLLRAHPVASVLHGLVVLTVLADPLVTLFFPTMYGEAAAILGTEALLATFVLATLRGRWSAGLVASACLAILAVGLAKDQFFLLPAVLLAMFLLTAGRPFVRTRQAAALIVAAGVPVMLYALPAGDAPRPTTAFRLDAYLGALAASSSDVPRTLARLGLPPRCDALVGASWHRLRGEQVEVACPEVATLPLSAFVPLLAQEPGTVLRAAAALLVQGQNAFGGMLGVVEGRDFGTLQDLAWWRRSPWAPALQQVPAMAWPGLVAGLFAAACMAALCFAWRRARALAAFGMLCAALAVVVAFVAGTSLVGDGFADAGKHLTLLSVSLATLVILAPGALFSRALAPFALAACIAMLLVGAGVTWWVRDQPLAFGVLDIPEGNRFEGDSVPLRGWALDPQGVERVEILVGDAPIAARYAVPKPGLDRVFPAQPDARAGGFEAEVNGTLLRPGTLVRIVVVNRRGIRSEVDRRRVAGSPT